jgi:CubicO group peptidase (beta-lactamase class C family)
LKATPRNRAEHLGVFEAVERFRGGPGQKQRNRKRHGLICALALVLPACAVQHEREPPRADQFFDSVFNEIYAHYRLPGLALGVVRDGKVIYSRAAGEVVAGAGRPITPETLFKIASNSKAMTSAVLARLVDAGKLRWDDPVIRHLPHFRMHDEWVTREIQVRDLLIHNSGLREGAGDLMLWPEPNDFTRADIIAGLAHLKPVNSFRAHYDYDNLMYVVAGEVAAAASGLSYEDLVRRELFEPLRMTRCQAGEFRRDEIGNVAQPHMRQDERNVPIREDGAIVPVSTGAAAGGIRCSLNDMLKWVRMWLDPELQGDSAQPWLTRAQREALWSSHMPMPISSRQRAWDGSRFNAYGYGWRLSDVDGVLRVAHTGTLAGMYSAVTLLPEQRTGFVFMINGDGGEARVVLNEVLVKYFTAHEDRARALQPRYYIDYLARERAERESATTQFVPPVRSNIPLRPAPPWLGVYRDAWFGEASLCEQGGKLVFSAAKSPKLTGDLMQSPGRVLVDWHDASIDAEAWLDFAGGTLKLTKVDPQADFSYDYEDLSFTRVRDCDAASAMHSNMTAEITARIDELMRDYSGQGPGASVLVVRDGVAVVRRSYGLANLEQRTAVTPTTNYRLASVTKQFTAAAILLLAEDGRLTLDDGVRKWLPTLPDVAQAVTIRQLLTHTSGLIDYEDVIPDSFSGQLKDADVLRLLEAQNRTYFAPGTSYRYSNSGYALLALIVERASDLSFAAFLRQRIFMPLGMVNTVAHEDGRSSVVNRAFGYTSARGSWERTDQSQTSAVLGDGGIYSSIDDLTKWDAALYDGRLLRPESLRAAFTAATTTDDSDIDYGFGWRITGETLWHSGETTGFRNVIVRYPKRRLTVVVLTNRNDPEPYRTALAIGELFLLRH